MIRWITALLCICAHNVQAQWCGADIHFSLLETFDVDTVVVAFGSDSNQAVATDMLSSDDGTYTVTITVLDSMNYRTTEDIVLVEEGSLSAGLSDGATWFTLHSGCGGSYEVRIVRTNNRGGSSGSHPSPPDTMRIRLIDACERDFRLQMPFEPALFEVVICEPSSLRMNAESYAEHLRLETPSATSKCENQMSAPRYTWFGNAPPGLDISGAVLKK